ncbi:unnamed protein product, partial [Choristocarpus tenellus]
MQKSRVAAAVAVGSRVTVAGKKGEVKFLGGTEFAAGEWIGVELDTPEGKNDGSVNGVHYFECRDGHGLFVKKAQIRLEKSSTISVPRIEAAATPGSATSDFAAPSPATVGTRGSKLAAIRERNRALKASLVAGKTPTLSSSSSSTGLRSPSG